MPSGMPSGMPSNASPHRPVVPCNLANLVLFRHSSAVNVQSWFLALLTGAQDNPCKCFVETDNKATHMNCLERRSALVRRCTLAPPLLLALVRGGHVSSIEGFHKWAKGGLKSCLLPPFLSLSLSPLPAH